MRRAATHESCGSGRACFLVDEPTSRLDRANAETVAEMLLEVARAQNVAVVCATHDPVLVERADDELSLGLVESTA